MAKQKSNQENFHLTNNQLLLGAIAGGIVGIGTALLCNSKNCSGLHHSLCQVCDTLTDRAQHIKENIVHRGEELYDKVDEWRHPHVEEESNLSLVIGGIAGGILGAAAVYLASEASYPSFKNLTDKAHHWTDDIKEKSECWTNVAKKVLNNVSDHISEGEEHVEKFASSASAKIDNIIEFANLGIKIFNALKQRG